MVICLTINEPNFVLFHQNVIQYSDTLYSRELNKTEHNILPSLRVECGFNNPASNSIYTMQFQWILLRMFAPLDASD